MVLERVRPRVSSKRAASGRVDFTEPLETGGGSGVIFLTMVNLLAQFERSPHSLRNKGGELYAGSQTGELGQPAGISLLRTARHNADIKKPLKRRCALAHLPGCETRIDVFAATTGM